jgi:triacylglycerol lipase
MAQTACRIQSAEKLERLQQRLTALLLLSIAMAMVWLLWKRQWVGAVMVGVALPCLHALVLLLEEAVSAAVWRPGEGPPAPNWSARMNAWRLEVRASIRVFYWEQPWRAKAFPTCLVNGAPGTPVLLVHGYLCNRGFWNPWRRPLLEAGHGSLALTLAPAFAGIDGHRAVLEAAFERLLGLTGRPPVVVAHSMGGLAVRAWLASRAPDRAAPTAVVTIGSPHQGTWLARWSRQANGRQMRIGSAWLAELTMREARMPARRFPWVCFFSDCDNVVFPVMCGALPGADNRHVPGQPHVALAWRPEVFRTVLALAAGPAGPH